jgi:DNA-binding transcriptional regulator YdaS (Cro superfamily)
MTLDSWLKTLSSEDRARAIARIASRCGVTLAAVRHWRNGTRRIKPEQCRLVVDESAGVVTLSDLRADVWPLTGAVRAAHRIKKVA